MVGRSYLLIEKAGVHYRIIVWTVTDNNGERDYEATMKRLYKDNAVLSGVEHENLCSMVGAPGDTEAWDNYKWGTHPTAPQKFKLIGQADLDFAVPEAFKAWGKCPVKSRSSEQH